MCHTLIVANVPRRKRLPRAIVAVTLTRQKGVWRGGGGGEKVASCSGPWSASVAGALNIYERQNADFIEAVRRAV